MGSDIWLPILIFFILLVFSAFFSGSESAYFSLSPSDLRHMREEHDGKGRTRRVLALLEKPRRLLLSILIGNTIVNIAAATVAALFTARLLVSGGIGRQSLILIEIIVVTLVILVFSEVSPKVFAVRRPALFAMGVSLPLRWIVRILTPLSYVFERMTQGVSAILGVKKEVPFADEEEFKTLFEVGEEKGTLDQSEREMIHSIFEFRQTMVKEVMVPRMDMVRVEKDMPIEEVLAIIKQKGHSRIPVYDEKVDDIIGILFVKDLLPYMRSDKKVPTLSEMARRAYFVPESKMIDELLREFQKERIHMAIVVDEYGGTAGLVTLEDLIEEIVGEIRDEYDREKPLYRKIDESTWIVEAKINIEELNDALGFRMPSEEDYESLGGFIFSQLGRIPEDKEKIPFEDLVLIVEKVQGQRIERVRIVRESSEDDAQKGR